MQQVTLDHTSFGHKNVSNQRCLLHDVGVGSLRGFPSSTTGASPGAFEALQAATRGDPRGRVAAPPMLSGHSVESQRTEWLWA